MEDLITEVRKVFMNILSTRDPGVEFQDMVDRMRGISRVCQKDCVSCKKERNVICFPELSYKTQNEESI